MSMKTEKITQPISSEAQRPFEQAEELVITNLEQLKVVADPLRLRIMELMSSPCTVKQVAAELDIPPTKLYYHINLLEKHGLIVVVDTRIVSGIIEKQYQLAAKSVRVDNNLLSPSSGDRDESLELAMDSLFNDTKADLLQSLHDGAIDMAEDALDHHNAVISAIRLHLTEEQARDLYQRFSALVDEFVAMSESQKGREDIPYYKFLYVLFPSSRKRLPRAE